MSYADAPWNAASTLVFRRPVIDGLGDILDRYGELLPLVCPGEELWVFHCQMLEGALDEDASDIGYFRSSDRIQWVNR